ncbi:MAG TPA: hypothetical protein GX394_09880 [Clostridiales bacterium]|jgi:predicted ribosomally synthesized peptide with SipW-like signal peptide|nr:hypothetical protein [Clostridiales bacterium]
MKKKYVFILTIVLISLLATSGSLAWFSANKEATNEFKMGTVGVEVVENSFKNITDVKIQSYDKAVSVKSLGTKRTYVRVRLIPIWSDHNLPVSNVKLILADNDDWIKGDDGYYYFKYYLTEGQVTSELLAEVEFTELGAEYTGKTFILKVVAEGVQASHRAWVDVWGIDVLPFEADKAWAGTRES